MKKHLYTIATLLGLSAFAILSVASCDSKEVAALENPNSPFGNALQTVTNALFQTEQPVLNAAIATFPTEVQALVQVAYVSLEAAATKAEQSGIKSLVVDGNQSLGTVTSHLNDVLTILSTTIHDDAHGTAAINPNSDIVPHVALTPVVP